MSTDDDDDSDIEARILERFRSNIVRNNIDIDAGLFFTTETHALNDRGGEKRYICGDSVDDNDSFDNDDNERDDDDDDDDDGDDDDGGGGDGGDGDGGGGDDGGKERDGDDEDDGKSIEAEDWDLVKESKDLMEAEDWERTISPARATTNLARRRSETRRSMRSWRVVST